MGESIRITGNKRQYWSQPSRDIESPTFVYIQCGIILPWNVHQVDDTSGVCKGQGEEPRILNDPLRLKFKRM